MEVNEVATKELEIAKSELALLLKQVKEETTKEVTDSLKKDFEAWQKSQKEDQEKKAGLYAKEVKPTRQALNAKFKALISATFGNEVKLKEMTTDASGTPYAGYTVDSELSAEIRHLITEYGVARREMSTIQLSKNSYKANDLVTDVVVTWTDEAAVILSSQVVLGQKSLELKKLAAIVCMTNELLKDEEIDLFAFVAERVAEQMAKAEDLAFFNGDGTSTYGSFTGLLQDTTINSYDMTGTTFASMTADDLLSLIDQTPSGALSNAKFYLNRTIMSIVRKLKDENNAYIYQMVSGGNPATIWGYPVVQVEAMPGSSATAEETAFVLFGDLKKACIFGYKGGMDVKKFDAGVVRNVANNADINLITTDREAVRITERVGYITIIPTAVSRLLTGAASA